MEKKSSLNVELINTLFPTSMDIGGGYKVELKAFKEVPGHDDSLPYQAKVYINGKYVAVAHNDGWGGITDISVVNEKSYDILNRVSKHLKENKIYSGKVYGIDIYMDNLSFVCDVLADNCTFRKTAESKAKNKLVLYKDKALSTVAINGLGRRKIVDMVGTPEFDGLWNNMKDKYTKKGYTILNAV